MDKDTFLRMQYLRMLNSDEFVVELWRSSMERFIADMWDRTPVNPGSQFLAPIDPEFGFAPENVEWQFPKVKPRRRPLNANLGEVAHKVQRSQAKPTKAERQANEKAMREAAKQAKRQALAEEFASWERLRKQG